MKLRKINSTPTSRWCMVELIVRLMVLRLVPIRMITVVRRELIALMTAVTQNGS